MPLWSVATGLAGVEFTAAGVEFHPAVPVEAGAFEFSSRVVAISRDEDGVTFRGWAEPPQEDAACKLTLRLHHFATSTASALLQAWTTTHGQGGETVETPGWNEVSAVGGEAGFFLLHDGRCGGGERVHFVIRF
eukprot:SAG11_NODE_53_length_19648_cov_14.691902_16_plen_134_part_00